jgi:beta-galactosidase/beta-glucuronidase
MNILQNTNKYVKMTNRKIWNKYPAGLLLIMVVLMMVSLKTLAKDLRPEHPRPDLYRGNWISLNGEWQFEIDKMDDGEARGLTHGKDLNGRITVPFCPESKLSGIGLGNTERLKNVWYRRMFDLPTAMQGKRVRLHFGGVDYKTWVYINGQLVGTHIGENVAFNFDVTKWLKDGSNELVVKVLDDMWGGLQPTGKQSHDQSEGCVYTRTTGIWQPVWLEGVGSSYIENISVVPDPDNSRVLITAKINGKDKNIKIKAEAYADGKLMGSEIVTSSLQNSMVLNLKEKKLWEPGSPFLYDLKFTLFSGKDKIDEVNSYFGLRKIAIEGRKILINDKPVFQRLILDQGFYPDGLWTAPSDEALKKDIEMSMACGYNGARLHQKVFEPRFLYWADKLGYLVWGEYPNWGCNFKPESYSDYVNEWTEILLRDRNHPSIVGWCAFNETERFAGELQQIIWRLTKTIDPTRPALETSGYTHTLPNSEVRDAHDYTEEPERLRKRWMDYFSSPTDGPYPPSRYFDQSSSRADRGVPFMISEVGGIGWASEGGWSYGVGPKTLDEFYSRYKGTVDAMLDNPNLFGFCYTQLTDIEQEKNGLYYYDRKPKFDVKKLHEITSRTAAYERGEELAPQPVVKILDAKWKVLVGAVQDGKLSTPYQYVVEKTTDDWMNEGFDDSRWTSGLAPFGYDSEKIRTEWKTSDIFLRKTFEYDGGELKNGAIVISYDDDTEVYVNGQKIFEVKGSIRDYKMHMLTSQLNKALKKGTNTIAVHTHQAKGGQHIDLAILID